MSFLSDIEKAEQTITPVAQQLAPGALEEFQKLKQSKLYELAHNKPKLMFYGIYSHGKSTLINALLGRDEAEMDIDPTTSEVHAYECPALNCMLIDTPGFQAQQTHTAIAEEECRKSNLIVFVLQSREFEGDIVWNKLKEVVERGQKACIIINDFDNCLDMPERKERILDKLRSRMQNVFNDPSVVKSVPFCLVNAKSALKARLEHKQKLAAYSRIADVEDLFRSLIKDCNLREVTERSLTQAFGQLIGECRAAAAAKLNDNALSEAEKTLQSLKKYREQFFSRLYTELDYQIKMMFLPELYLSCLSQGDTASLTGEMEQRIARLGTAMETATQREVEALARRFNSRYESFRILLDRLSAMPQDVGDSKTVFGRLLTPDRLKSLEQFITPGMVEQCASTILQQTKQWFPDLMKDVGSKTIATWSKTAGKIIGPIITLLTTLFEIWSCYNDQQKKRDMEERQRQRCIDAAHETEKTIRENVRMQITHNGNRIFDDLFSNLEEVVRCAREQNDKMHDAEAVLDAAERLIA